MRIAITGATGFVGREALQVCARLGHEAIPLTRTASGLEKEVIAGPLEQMSLDAVALTGIDAVLHLAARTHVMGERESEAMSRYREVNVEGTGRLLDLAIAAGVPRFVFMSSVKAVAERSDFGVPIHAETPPQPEDAYGRTKLEAENLVRTRCTSAGIEWVVLRPPLVLGEGARGNLSRVLGLLKKGVPLPLRSVCNRRSLISVSHLAEAAVRACAAARAANQILMTCDRTWSTPELLIKLSAAEGTQARLIPFPVTLLHLAGRALGRAAEVDRLCGSLEVDPKSTFDMLGWHPSAASAAPSGRDDG